MGITRRSVREHGFDDLGRVLNEREPLHGRHGFPSADVPGLTGQKNPNGSPHRAVGQADAFARRHVCGL